MIRSALSIPAVYHLVQQATGAFGARVKAIAEYLPIAAGSVVIDIGCGPGHLAARLPAGVEYHGFDVSPGYIAYARRHFGHLGRFHCRPFDASTSAAVGRSDVVLMMGLLHHLPNNEALELAAIVRASLRPNGRWFTLDGVYEPGQQPLARWALDHDRGKFVRDAAGYRELIRPQFPDAAFHIRHDLARFPTSLMIAVATAPADRP